ncbi:PadR family transcriptional regulator [Bacillus thuringiensis]|nr:PadR family transcriptional regulator [Bacillus thuringiensis]
MGMSVEGVKFFLEIPDGERVEIKGGVDWADTSPGETGNYDFDFTKEISVPCTFEEPQNIKELQEIGFTPQQAWNIHLHKGESWKENSKESLLK